MVLARSSIALDEGKRVFTSRDSIEMSYFGDLWSSRSTNASDDGTFAPDGRHYVQLTHRGIVSSGVQESTIWIFDTDQIRGYLRNPKGAKPPAPRPIARMSGAVNGGANDAYHGNIITQLRWSKDSGSLLFRGTPSGETHHLYDVDLEGTIKQLTPDSQDVQDYDVARGKIVYLSGPEIHEEQAWWSQGPKIPDIEVGTGSSMLELLYPNFRRNVLGVAPSEIWTTEEHASPSPVRAPVGDRALDVVATRGSLRAFSVSPTGMMAIVTAYANHVPASWEQFTIRGNDANANKIQADGVDAKPIGPDGTFRDLYRPDQYVLLNLSSGSLMPLVEAPLARSWPGVSQVAWSPDGGRVAVSLTYLPGTRSPCEVALIDLAKAPFSTECIKELSVEEGEYALAGLTWGPGSSQVTASYRPSPHEATQGRSQRSEIIETTKPYARTSDRSAHDGTIVYVQEALNEPPVLVASDARAKESAVILNPNPQLARIRLGTARVYHWQDQSGRHIVGGLLLPPNYKSGQHYPLVIQTHGFDASSFLRTGYSETGYAAQALAGRGLAVLQVEEPRDDFYTPRQAMEDGLEPYVSAIDHLVSDDFIDARRVGLTGFSLTGIYLITSLERAPDRFAAAVFADADPATLGAYLTYVDFLDPRIVQGLEGLYAGTKPYGDGLKRWLAEVPGFNTDRVRTPILFSATDPYHLVSGMWELYGSLRDQQKPVDLLYMRGGQHNLTKPLERLALQEMVVDWYDFWLNGHEDPDSGKAEQYRRWEKLCDQQQTNNPDRPTFCVASSKAATH